jgi:hypothetical protein
VGSNPLVTTTIDRNTRKDARNRPWRLIHNRY